MIRRKSIKMTTLLFCGSYISVSKIPNLPTYIIYQIPKGTTTVEYCVVYGILYTEFLCTSLVRGIRGIRGIRGRAGRPLYTVYSYVASPIIPIIPIYSQCVQRPCYPPSAKYST